MKRNGTVKDIMVDIFDFPHVPYWFTIRQAMQIIKKAFIETEKKTFPYIVIVFDEKYNLLGTFTPKEIIKGLEPKMKPVTIKDAEIAYIDESALAVFEAGLFNSQAKELIERPVSDIMIPAKVSVSPDDPLPKAAFLMVKGNLEVLPVLEKNKLVGLIKMIDVFVEISNIALER